MAEQAPVNLNGKWKMYKQEKFEDFMGAMGMNWVIRKMASKSKPDITIIQEGSKFKIITKSAFFTQHMDFEVGVEFTAKTQGQDVKALAEWVDATLRLTQTPSDGVHPPLTITRSLTDEGDMLQQLQCKDVIAKRWFHNTETDQKC